MFRRRRRILLRIAQGIAVAIVVVIAALALWVFWINVSRADNPKFYEFLLRRLQ